MESRYKKGSVNPFYLTVAAAIALLAVLVLILANLAKPPGDSSDGDTPGGRGAATELLVYCPAGLRKPVEQIAAEYEREYGIAIRLQYGGSNTLLNQIELAKTGDLFLAADDSYTAKAREKGLVKETIPLAVMHPVIAVKKGNPKQIRGIADLLRDDVKTALGNPDQAAIGKLTRQALMATGEWDRLRDHVTRGGVFKPTVPEVANDVKLGSVDAGIIWDTTVTQYADLEQVPVKELEAATANVAVGVLAVSQTPTAALRFARYLAARDRGLVTFKEKGYRPVDGDQWAATPEITFYCGTVNRRAVDRIIKAFEEREGVVVNTIYNGCGILTGQMLAIRDQRQSGGFPDTYMACDRYYLENVKDWFQEDVDVSDTEVVIAVAKGNPAGIKNLSDLTRSGMRISVGQPKQCTIGVLTKQVLEAEGVYDGVMKNVVTQTATSAMLVPTVTTGSVDATLAYATDTRAESDKVDVIRIESQAAKAVQPFAIARSSDHKYLGRRLYGAIAASRSAFEDAGFHFRLSDEAKPRDTLKPAEAAGATAPVKPAKPTP